MLQIFGDLLIGMVCFYLGTYIRFGELQENLQKYNPVILKIVVFIVILIFCSFLMELYNHEKNSGKKEILTRSLIASLLSFFVLSAFYFSFPYTGIGRGMLVISLLVFWILQSLWHITYLVFLHFPGFAKRVLILGTGPTAEKIGNLINSTNHQYILTGYINFPPEPAAVSALPVVNYSDSIVGTAKREGAHKIIVSLSERRGVLPIKDMLNCKLSGIDILDGPSFYEQVTGKLLIEDIKPSWFIFSDGFKITNFKRFYKRIFDVAFAVIGLLITIPLIPIIAFLIKIDSPGPVFFRQTRVGEAEKRFVLFKFRTMKHEAETKTGAVWAQKKDPRVTRFGKLLRKTRLDEIPQLYNVLKGEMSFIGPRPERPEFVEKLEEIIPYYSERHFLKPGITGWAQVKYPYGASVEDALEKLRYDVYYIKNFSLFLDMLVVLETVKVVLFGRGSR